MMELKYIMQLLVFILTCKDVYSIKCYHCSSIRDKGCWRYNLNSSYLRECPSSSGRNKPVCRSLSQVHYFIESQEVTLLRECAYIYDLPLDCKQSKFSGLHYSLSCECNSDGCNIASGGCATNVYLLASMMTVLLWNCGKGIA